ncbi:P2R1A-PPP2R2A-interacting phosphatase regulator 1-like isoform X1 [Ptychodera flava]|uniref:P2R1A-PPP2R2A-interacting phosphatase regulator 1-like isoform X1 n=1 Tax=Ptychodera flava TaxID=63121 RepID=UPI00396A1094
MDAGEMEVDAYQPPCSQAGTNLRRSNSLPSINTSSGPTSSHEAPNFEPFVVSRIRRHSTSLSANVNNNVNKSPSRASSTPIKIPSRINQIKQEERLAHDVNRRESVHEKEVTSSFQLSHSWDDFTLGDSPSSRSDKSLSKFAEPLTIFPSSLPLSSSPSPSPTRILGKQCYSPSMQMPVRSSSLTPSPTPSPTRRTFSSKRSMSPVTIRPSILAQTLKRKLGDCDVEMSPPKRYASSDSVPLSCPQPINHSSSNSSLEDTSPAQSIPSGPVVSLTSSPTTTTTSCFNVFKPVRNNTS